MLLNRVSYATALILAPLAAGPGLGAAPAGASPFADPPATGISGVYEVMTGTGDAEPLIRYFAEFGYAVTAEGELSAGAAKRVYGVDSALKSYRLRNGDIDAHGLLRILEWAAPAGSGLGYAPPMTVGMRMSVMHVRDVFRLYDVFSDARAKGEPWLPTEPIYDDIYGLEKEVPGFFNRRTGVREMAVYGGTFNHVFFQRYGYDVPGYGTIGDHAPLRSSEFTHHDFIVRGDLNEILSYYVQVLGLRAEQAAPVLNGDWQKGPRRVFDMQPGDSHWYMGFISPNNICGKLKFFAFNEPRADRSEQVFPGALGITLHSLWTPRLAMVHKLARRHGLQPTAIRQNEFDERSFVFTGPDGVSWQIIERERAQRAPVTEFKPISVNH